MLLRIGKAGAFNRQKTKGPDSGPDLVSESNQLQMLRPFEYTFTQSDILESKT
jgi:hypothetical protein